MADKIVFLNQRWTNVAFFPYVRVWLNLIGSLPGEEEEIEVEQEEEQKGPDLKLASRRDMYSICQSVGLGQALLHIVVSLSLSVSPHPSLSLNLSMYLYISLND